jgi:hypothetical protein
LIADLYPGANFIFSFAQVTAFSKLHRRTTLAVCEGWLCNGEGTQVRQTQGVMISYYHMFKAYKICSYASGDYAVIHFHVVKPLKPSELRGAKAQINARCHHPPMMISWRTNLVSFCGVIWHFQYVELVFGVEKDCIVLF